jgi:hypothetical protein
LTDFNDLPCPMIWTQSSRYGIVLAVKWSNFIYNVKRNSGSLVRGMNRWVESFEVRGLYSLKSKYARWCFSIHSLKSSENNYDSFDFLNIWKTITKYCEFIFIRGIPIFVGFVGVSNHEFKCSTKNDHLISVWR